MRTPLRATGVPLAALALLTAACSGHDPDDAVPDAGPVVDAGPPPTVWPNPLAPANSSPWLRENHDRLTALEPRVLVLDVLQREKLTPIRTFVDGLVAAYEELTRYHGYSDPGAEPFVRYQIDRIVDLKDPGGAEYPAFWPPASADGFDVGALFTADFAPHLGYADPDVPGRFLTMCELFERGIINELWINAEDGRNIYENQSRLQVYDDALQPVPGRFEGCTNGCYYDPGARVNCAVSVRMQEINLSRGVGCATHAAGHTLENLRHANPYLQANATRFFGFDLDVRHDLPVSSLYDCPYSNGICVDFPSPESIVNGPTFPKGEFEFDDWGDACGSVHFAPNSRFQYDYYSNLPALSSCASYGLADGADGRDRRTPYTQAVTLDYEHLHGDCGGGWMVYLGQSMPGRGNAARDATGAPMRNWWPFVFY
jgi:hypothetical protein